MLRLSCTLTEMTEGRGFSLLFTGTSHAGHSTSGVIRANLPLDVIRHRFNHRSVCLASQLAFLTGCILSPINHNDPGTFAKLFLVLLLEKP